MIVKPAFNADLDTVLRWRAERTRWLARLGEDQWQVPWPRASAQIAVETQELWMVWDTDTPVASFMLSDHERVDDLWKLDTDYGQLWLPDDQPQQALYVSKMVVPLANAGEGLGAEILDWCAGQAFDTNHFWLRLDAWTTNIRLRTWYEKQGFELVRTVGTRASGACYQRPAQPYTGWRLKTEP